MKGLPELAIARQPKSSVSSPVQLRILVINDDPLEGKILEQVAAHQSAKVHRVMPEDLDSLKGEFDAAIIDVGTGDTEAAELARKLEGRIGIVPTVLVSATNRDGLPKRKWPKSIIGFVPESAGRREAVLSAIELCRAKLAPLLKKG